MTPNSKKLVLFYKKSLFSSYINIEIDRDIEAGLDKDTDIEKTDG